MQENDGNNKNSDQQAAIGGFPHILWCIRRHLRSHARTPLSDWSTGFGAKFASAKQETGQASHEGQARTREESALLGEEPGGSHLEIDSTSHFCDSQWADGLPYSQALDGTQRKDDFLVLHPLHGIEFHFTQGSLSSAGDSRAGAHGAASRLASLPHSAFDRLQFASRRRSPRTCFTQPRIFRTAGPALGGRVEASAWVGS